MPRNIDDLFGGTETLLTLIERIYASAEHPELWNGVLCEIARLLACESVALFAGAPDARTPQLFAMIDIDPMQWQRYEAYYAAINPIMRRCERLLSPGDPWQSDAVMANGELEGTEFYNDFFLPNQMHYSLGLRLCGSDVPLANLSCQRTKAGGPFEARESTILQTLRPHLLRALSLRHRLSVMGVQAHGFATALEAYDQAVVGVSDTGSLLFSNAAADRLLACPCGLEFRKGQIRCEDREASQRLLRFIACAGKAAPQPIANSLVVRDAEGAAKLHITVLPSSGQPFASGDLNALLFLSKPGEGVTSRATTLGSAFGLTPLEVRITDLLGTGMSVGEIADHLRLAKESVRFYVKRVLGKTETGRQANLIALLSKFPVHPSVRDIPSGTKPGVAQ